ncbi:MAG TPA: SUMF1/EgtB/PvdO family nonheme iron enzyme [Solirubrobacteraceae bacterium]|jgi:iron(II)-dependent oxidoreductase|nr:SUMF1/EgtB/PvdO family nonheme iron enzyme [Solirubrobacteraceae bacterium]
MATRAVTNTPLSPDAAQMLQAMRAARERTLALVADLGDEQLERVLSPIMSPLAWDLGHIAAYEDLWLGHRYGGLELLRPDLANLYDAFETPRAVRGEIEALGPAQALEYMAQVSDRVAGVIAERGLGDGVLCEMVLRHELQHTETMRQAMGLGGLLSAADQASIAAPLDPRAAPEGWIEVPAGSFEMGAAADGFAYDNERPRHTIELPAFQIARRPVGNASWLRFSEGGGYERREWWSREGWAWKEEHDITHHASAAAGHPEAPVCHVSWFEADAFARAHCARLPTEAEWERAVTWTQQTGEELAGVGRVWEWTDSHFHGYPGFAAYPYREYSQVFFGERYRVLRGSSWATLPRVASITFRNWDLPQRRQIFAGVRLAKEV